MQYLLAFLVGGAICALAQIILDTTKWTPAYIIVALVSIGALLQGLGIYDLFQDLVGAGALIPVSGFGSSITKGMVSEAQRLGWYGLFTGAFEITGLGLSTAIIFSAIAAFFVKPQR